MKKILFSLLLFLLVGCSSVPNGFDKDKLESETQMIIDLMEDYQEEEVISRLRVDLQSLISADQLHQNLVTKYESVGAVKSETSFTIGDTKDPQTDEVYATVIAQVEHENGRSTYTISFNTDYECVGLYIK